MNKQEDLFDYGLKKDLALTAPLSARMRPVSLDEFIGQRSVVGDSSALRRSIKEDHAGSLILWGPPGCGKTTLAKIIAKESRSKFYPISAVAAGVADLRKIIAAARDNRSLHSVRSILFIDEIHRFNKAQQDAILPFVENGLVTLIGATTENPSFEVNNALLSRCRVYVLSPLTSEDMLAIINRALEDKNKGLARYNPVLNPDALDMLTTQSAGDARVALNTLEYAVLASPPDSEGKRTVTLPIMEDALTFRTSGYDKKGEKHYDVISAFIKSMRNSDADAAVYWLACMVEGGEDPLFIARRMVIFASEDVGLADPHAVTLAVSVFQSVHFVGMPEGVIPLAEAAVYLALAPKSNSSYSAVNRALSDVRREKSLPVPKHLRNPVTNLMKENGYGKGYKYAHDYENHVADMSCLPDAIKDRTYYVPSDSLVETELLKALPRKLNFEKNVENQ